MIIPMSQFATNSTLAGAIPGQNALGLLIKKTPAVSKAEVCFLDFSEVEIATASFLRESICAFRHYVRAHAPHVYPVAANMSDQTIEEFDSFLRLRNDAFLICRLNSSGEAANARLIGLLDGKQRNAFDEVLARQETDAPTLSRESNEEVSTTAWNNRLSALSAKGILIETTNGRGKFYRPVLEGLHHGT